MHLHGQLVHPDVAWPLPAGPGAKQTYKVTVRTSDKRGAGTDADITIKLIGAEAQSAELKLESSANNFERNQVNAHLVFKRVAFAANGLSCGPCLLPSWATICYKMFVM